MSAEWTEKTAAGIVAARKTGTILFLGNIDTSKTTVAESCSRRAAGRVKTAFLDADMGQSHIGPPGTVGWAPLGSNRSKIDRLKPRGISFVGDVMPVRHLLQFTTALHHCFQQARAAADIVVIDTPGYVSGPAAAVLWWSVQQMLQPDVIAAIHRTDELGHIIKPLEKLDSALKVYKCPDEVPGKSREKRRQFRQKRLRKYFKDSRRYTFDLRTTPYQLNGYLGKDDILHRAVGLRDSRGDDVAMGFIEKWDSKKSTARIRCPKLDKTRIKCLVIGDMTVEFD
jgi:polynucleotide 5'-hydroxyl-kinase GRC3/NOL9